MKILLTWLACFSVLLSGGAAAQGVQLFSPPERDFRVLMPAKLERINTPDGSVEFRGNDGVFQYSVFRHDARRLAGGINAGDDIAKRIATDDQRARTNSDQTLPPDQFMFRVGSARSMHRAIVEPGRYYELVMKGQHGEGVSVPDAQDFFNSFQLGRASSFQALSNLPPPETCQTRSNAFTKRFCEYLSCMRADADNHPICRSLPMLRRD